MRVTNALVTRSLSRRLLENQRLLAEAQERVATGKRVRKMSDDPTAGSAIMQASAQLRGIEQYRRNVDAIGSRVDAEESALDQITQLMTRAKELGIGQLGATANADSRAAAAAEVQQLFAQALQIGNQRFGDEYLFGGNTAQDHAPFDPTQAGTAPRFVSLVAGPHDGKTVFVDTRVLETLHDLGAALAANDEAGLATTMGALDRSFTGVQTLVGDIGARQNQVDTIRTQLDALEQNLDLYRSGLSEVDMEQAITEMVGRQTAYQAAMLASSKVLGLSLTDYLR